MIQTRYHHLPKSFYIFIILGTCTNSLVINFVLHFDKIKLICMQIVLNVKIIIPQKKKNVESSPWKGHMRCFCNMQYCRTILYWVPSNILCWCIVGNVGKRKKESTPVESKVWSLIDAIHGCTLIAHEKE